jgi:ribosomal protein L24E
MASTTDGKGYWLVASDGGIFSFGDAKFYGSTGSLHLNAPIVGMASTPDSKGYWLVASDGGIFSFGDANFYGSTGSSHLNAPIVGMASTGDGKGYWFVASDGGIFSFGDAKFYGSTGATHLNSPIVGMSTTNDGGGYWFVAADGGVFSFGDAKFYGSTGATHLNAPIVGIATSTTGSGYWLVASDGGIFSFGDATFAGSVGGTHLNRPIVGIAGLPWFSDGTPADTVPLGSQSTVTYNVPAVNNVTSITGYYCEITGTYPIDMIHYTGTTVVATAVALYRYTSSGWQYYEYQQAAATTFLPSGDQLTSIYWNDTPPPEAGWDLGVAAADTNSQWEIVGESDWDVNGVIYTSSPVDLWDGTC